MQQLVLARYLNKRLIELYPNRFGVLRVHRVLGVNKGADTATFLSFGYCVEGESCLT